MPESTSLNDLIRHLNDLPDDQLRAAACAIQAILEARAELRGKPQAECQGDEQKKHQQHSHGHIPSVKKKSGRRGGYYEHKTIKGHKYWYLRWWDNGIHRSTYIGKVRTRQD